MRDFCLTPGQRANLKRIATDLRLWAWEQHAIGAAIAVDQANVALRVGYQSLESVNELLQRKIAELEAEVARWKHLYESQHHPRHDGFKPTTEGS